MYMNSYLYLPRGNNATLITPSVLYCIVRCLVAADIRGDAGSNLDYSRSYLTHQLLIIKL